MKLRAILKKSIFLIPFILYFAGMHLHQNENNDKSPDIQRSIRHDKSHKSKPSATGNTLQPNFEHNENLEGQTVLFEPQEQTTETNEDTPVEEVAIQRQSPGQ